MSRPVYLLCILHGKICQSVGSFIRLLNLIAERNDSETSEPDRTLVVGPNSGGLAVADVLTARLIVRVNPTPTLAVPLLVVVAMVVELPLAVVLEVAVVLLKAVALALPVLLVTNHR